MNEHMKDFQMRLISDIETFFDFTVEQLRILHRLSIITAGNKIVDAIFKKAYKAVERTYIITDKERLSYYLDLLPSFFNYERNFKLGMNDEVIPDFIKQSIFMPAFTEKELEILESTGDLETSKPADVFLIGYKVPSNYQELQKFYKKQLKLFKNIVKAVEIISTEMVNPTKESIYATIPQNKLSNQILFANTKNNKKDEAGIYNIDTPTGSVTIGTGIDNADLTDELTKTILAGFSPTTRRFYRFMLELFDGTPDFNIKIDDFMERCNIIDRKTAYEQAKRALMTMGFVRVSLDKGSSYHSIALLGSEYKVNKQGLITCSYSDKFCQAMKDLGYYKMELPKSVFTIDINKYTYSQDLAFYIYWYLRTNRHTDNILILTVKSLLGACPSFVTDERLKHFYDRIYTPFERDMNALEDYFTWCFVHSDSIEWTSAELSNICYKTFEKTRVKITFKDIPDYSEIKNKKPIKKALPEKKKKE